MSLLTGALFALQGACATARPVTPKGESIGTRDGARARGLLYARAAGLIGEEELGPLRALPLGTSPLTDRSDARVPLELAASLQEKVSPSACALQIVLEDRMTDGDLFHLSDFRVALDDVEVAASAEMHSEDARRYLLFEGAVPPGRRALTAWAQYRGGGAARGYLWRMQQDAILECSGDRSLDVVVAGVVSSSDWLEAPRLVIEGDTSTAPARRVVRNEAAIAVATYRVNAAAGLVPHIAARELPSASPFVADPAAPTLALTAPSAATCHLVVELADELSWLGRRALVGGAVQVDGVPIVVAPTIEARADAPVDYVLLDGPVARGEHSISASLTIGSASTSDPPQNLRATARARCDDDVARVQLRVKRCWRGPAIVSSVNSISKLEECAE